MMRRPLLARGASTEGAPALKRMVRRDAGLWNRVQVCKELQVSGFLVRPAEGLR